MSTHERALFDKLQALPPQQRAEVEDFVDFLAAKTKKRAAFDRLLAIAPALEAAGVEPMSEEEIDTEIKAVRAERRARRQQEQAKDSVRIVLDTNVVMSALLWRGNPYRLLQAIRQHPRLQLYSSPILLEELTDVLTRPRRQPPQRLPALRHHTLQRRRRIVRRHRRVPSNKPSSSRRSGDSHSAISSHSERRSARSSDNVGSSSRSLIATDESCIDRCLSQMANPLVVRIAQGIE